MNPERRRQVEALILLEESHRLLQDRLDDFLADCASHPTDVFPLTEGELRDRLSDGEPFWTRAVKEAVVLFDRSTTREAASNQPRRSAP